MVEFSVVTLVNEGKSATMHVRGGSWGGTHCYLEHVGMHVLLPRPHFKSSSDFDPSMVVGRHSDSACAFSCLVK